MHEHIENQMIEIVAVELPRGRKAGTLVLTGGLRIAVSREQARQFVSFVGKSLPAAEISKVLERHDWQTSKPV